MVRQECESGEYELCGRTVSLGREGLQLGEALLNGRAMGIDEPSVAETVLGAVSSHPDPAVRKVGCLHYALAFISSKLQLPPGPNVATYPDLSA